MSTARTQQNDLKLATGVNVTDQTIRNRFHEGGLTSSTCPFAHCLVLWSLLALTIEY